MQTQDPTPFYIRTSFGATYYVETLEEALEEFASDDGYRLTLESDDIQVVIRRSQDDFDEQGVHATLGEKAYHASVVVRRKTK